MSNYLLSQTLAANRVISTSFFFWSGQPDPYVTKSLSNASLYIDIEALQELAIGSNAATFIIYLQLVRIVWLLYSFSFTLSLPENSEAFEAFDSLANLSIAWVSFLTYIQQRTSVSDSKKIMMKNKNRTSVSAVSFNSKLRGLKPFAFKILLITCIPA